MIDFLLRVFEENRHTEAIIYRDRSFDYAWLLEQIGKWREVIRSSGVQRGTIVSIEADFSPNGIALFLALIDHSCILVPLTKAVEAKIRDFIKIAEVELSFELTDNDSFKVIDRSITASHHYYLRLRQMNTPGLVLFSSGSTGLSKAAIHDFAKLLDKFKVRRKKNRTITFLLYDHIGGVNTMLYTLSNGGTIITVEDRRPDTVFRAIERHRAELLPTSPTFINLILLSKVYQHYDVTSLKMVTYGTEPMPESTLKLFHDLFPYVSLRQTYGLSEVGILQSKSKSDDSLWVKIGGRGFKTRIIDGVLQIKAQSAMLGYLNAPNPFTNDGWFNTGDSVEVDGEFIRILGRQSEIINVGGEKVYPVEVENIIQQMENIAEVVVHGEKNAILGNVVCARISLIDDEPKKEFVARLKSHCRKYLQAYKVPVKVDIISSIQYNARFKKQRKTIA